MGCAQSVDADGRGGDAGGRRWRDRDARIKRHEVRTDTPASIGAAAVDPTVLSQPLLDDLRAKMRHEALSTAPVTKWIECITEPSADDNADLYDPVRRHRLSMESVLSRQRRSMSSSAVSQSVSIEAQKKTDSEGDAILSEDAAADGGNPTTTHSAAATTVIEDPRGALDNLHAAVEEVQGHHDAQEVQKRSTTPTGAHNADCPHS